MHPEKLGYHLPRILGVKLSLFSLFLVAITVGFYTWGYEVELYPLYFLIGINLFLSTTYIYLRSNIAAIGKYRTDSLLSALDKLLMLFILGALSWIPFLKAKFTIIWLVYGQMAAYAISCLVALIILRNHLSKLTLVFSFTYFKKLIRWSYPFILILLFMSIYNKMDGIMLERMLGDEGLQAGIYAAGYRFVDAFNMLGYLVAALLLPMYSSNLKDAQVITDLLYTGLKIMVVGACIASLSMIFYGNDILPYVYSAADDYYAKVLSVLMVSFIGVSIAYLFGTLLVANNNLKSFNILLSVGVILNLGLNLYLIPKLQAYGAAVATAFTQIAVMVGQIALVYKYTEVRFEGKLYTVILTFSLLCAIIFFGVNTLAISWVYRTAISIFISLVLALLLRLIDIRGLLAILKKRPT